MYLFLIVFFQALVQHLHLFISLPSTPGVFFKLMLSNASQIIFILYVLIDPCNIQPLIDFSSIPSQFFWYLIFLHPP